MKNLIKRIIRAHFPNIPPLRKLLNANKLKYINKYIMKEEDALAGESNLERQKQIVEEYSLKWPKYCKQLNKKIDEYISKCESVGSRSDIADLRRKVLFACYAYGFMPDEFFAYELEYKGRAERLSYYSNTEVLNFVYNMNDIVDVGIYFDKYQTYKKFKKYYRRDAVCLEKASDYSAFVDFLKKHPVFVKKDVTLSKGDSVERIDTHSCGKKSRQLFDEMIVSGKHIVEESVVQSAIMSRLNPSSVNTIRCMTFLTNEGIKIGPCFLKVGQGGAFVDNGAKGGILIGIDNRTGILETYGYDEFLTEYQNHPDTGISFVGYQLPEWEKMCALAKEMSAQTPTVRYVGWDMAHTDKGWAVIEGNGSGQLIGPQIVWKRGFKEDINKIINK